MKQYIIIILLVFLSFAVFAQSAFSAPLVTEEKPKTIRELQENAEGLKKEQLRLEFKWNTFQIGNETLGDFIIDLNQEQFNSLEDIITEYQGVKKSFEVKLSEADLDMDEENKIEKDLLLLKKDFYTNLIPYIKTEKLEAYKNYIASDVNFNEKSKIVTRDIENIEGQKKERIEVIQEQIEDNNRDLRKSLEKKLRESVTEKLDIFTQTEKFKTLSNENKILVFSSLQDRIKIFRENYENNSENTTSFVIDEKVLLLELVEEIVEGYINNWDN